MADFGLLMGEPLEGVALPAMSGSSPPQLTRPRAQTPHEALDALRQLKGAQAAIERFPQLGQVEVWGEIATFTVCRTTGTASSGTFVWDADFPGVLLSLADAEDNCYVYFAGAESLGEVIPPQTLTGQIWCYFTVPEPGYYVFLPSAQTYPDEYYGPDYFATVECLIDDISFGEFQIRPSHPLDQPMLANLASTSKDPSVGHRFTIRQVSGAVFFWSLRVLRIPINIA
jgi:hypothetical protein